MGFSETIRPYPQYSRYEDAVTGLSIDTDLDTVGAVLLQGINDPLIQRHTRIGELGLSREAPTINEQTRGEHIIAVSLSTYAILRQNNFSEHDARLGFVLALMHDPHPAGGDGMKLALGIDEKSVAQAYYFSGEAEARFTAWFTALGLDPVSTKTAVLAMIRREADDPISALVHGITKDVADTDWIDYTIHDIARGSLTRLMSRRDRPRDCEGTSDHCPVVAQLIESTYVQDELHYLPEDGRSPVPTAIFHYKDFDPIPHMEWVAQTGWVFRDSEIFSHYVVACACLHRSLYLHPCTKGPELMLKRGLQTTGALPYIAKIAMQVDDAGLLPHLAEYGLDYWTTSEANLGWRYRSTTSSLIPETLKPGEYRFRLPTFRLRTKTLVRQDGRIMPFEEARPDIIQLVNQIIAPRSGKEIVLVDDLYRERPRFGARRT